ncbi:MAG: YraN family protein [Nannocystaceae bacterium]
MQHESTRARGLAAEQEAARFLESRGLAIVERNVEIGGGELDLVALLRGDEVDVDEAPAEAEPVDTIVFVEVRSRGDLRAGSPLETIGRRKRAHLRRAASAWLIARGLWERVAVRFDVVSVVGCVRVEAERAENEEAPKILWIPGAFDADE